ncbi:MAG: hypothetical protein NTW55_03040, partial [Planctomycetota bacterium]|nr:hypothetical protein [Planctomycetota bacterium]
KVSADKNAKLWSETGLIDPAGNVRNKTSREETPPLAKMAGLTDKEVRRCEGFERCERGQRRWANYLDRNRVWR